MIKKDVESDGKEGGKTGQPQENKMRRKFQKEFGLEKMERNMKEGKHTGKIKNLMEPSDGIENEMMKTKVEYDGEEDGATSKAQLKKCENPTSNTGTNTTNDSRYNSGTHAGRDINNGKVTNMEIKSVNDEGNGEEVEAEAEAETEVATNNSNNSNTAIIIVKVLEEQVRKMKTLETRIRAADNEGVEKQKQ